MMNDIEMMAMGTSSEPSMPKRLTRGTVRFGAGLFRFLMKLLLVVFFVGGGILIGGFLQFSNTVISTPQAPDVEPAQGIVVLTGGSARIAGALDLMVQKKGERLLISGLNPSTRKKDVQNMHSSHDAQFACCVDVESVAVDTISNAQESARWVKEKGYKSIILVTSGYHMPRSLLEFRRAMPEIKIVTYTVPLQELTEDGWWQNPQTLRLMVSEYLKYVGAWMREYFTADTISALRANVFGR